MKKFLLLLVALTSTLAVFAHSEEGESFIVGRVGVYDSKYADPSCSYDLGLALGIGGGYQICDPLAVTVDALFVREGSKRKYDAVVTDYNVNSLLVPVMINFYPVSNLAIKAGIQPGFCLSAKAVGIELKSYTKNPDWAIPFGISYEVGGATIDVRYILGLTNCLKMDGFDSKQRGFMFTLGYKFNLQ